VTGSRTLRAFTALTAVLPAHEQHLAASLAALPTGDASPFARMASTHFARFVVLDRWTTAAPGWRSSRPPLQHLLFTSTSNSPPDEHVEELRVCLGPLADQTWGQCVGYPGSESPRLFRRYLLHNRLRVSLVYRAYAATVGDVRAGLDLRRRHAAFALAQQGWSDEELRARFRQEFGA
jgi:hypothetical protein